MRTLTRHSALLVAGLGGAVLLGGCGERSEGFTNSAGSLALSRDDAFLYAVDSDNDLVAVVDTASNTMVGQVKVGRAPERVVVGPDDTIYVSNRGSRSVSVLKRGAGTWSEVLQVPVGVEPIGLAVSGDNRTLYVVNSTSLDSPEVGTLTAIDVKTLQPRWDLVVGEEPRGVTLLPGNRALVTLYRRGDVVTVDLSGPSIVQQKTELYQRANASALGFSNATRFDIDAPRRTFHPRAMSDAVVTPDGKRAFAPVVWAREDSLSSPSGPGGGGGGGDSYGGGPCGGGGGVATAGLSTFEVSSEETIAVADDMERCENTDPTKDYPATTLVSPEFDRPIQHPTVTVMDSTGNWLFVVNQSTNNVAVMPVANRMGARPATGFDGSFGFRMSSIHSLVQVGAGPNGIALTRDGRKAYVYNAFDHSISTLTHSSQGGGMVVTTGRPLKVADDVLPADVVAGRKLFFSASDARMTSASTGVACVSCHLDVRDDGHVWIFSDGPRQTPSLAGRKTTVTAPFHWNGEFNTLAEFLGETVNNRMGGSGATVEMAAQLSAFIDSVPLPENPLRTATPSEAQLRGALVFEKAECNTCHGSSLFTDNTFHDVGTKVLTGTNPDLGLERGLNVPSLLGISRTAPYLHDGSSASLRSRILASRYNDLHGKTSQLSDGEINDLVEYLNTL